MSLYSQFAMNEDAESKGILLDYGSGGRIRIARAGGHNIAFAKAIETFNERYGQLIKLDVLDNVTAEKELVKIYAKTVILGWESGPENKPKVGVIPGPDGKDLKFNFDNCCKLLKDLPDLFIDIRNQSQKLSNFRDAKVEKSVKNLQTSSSTG